MNKQFFILSLLLVFWVSITGCAKDGLPSINDPKYAMSQPVDANKDGDINGKDVVMLETNAIDCFFNAVFPFYEEAGVQLKIGKGAPLVDILKALEESDTKENIQRLQENLSYVKYKKLRDGKDQFNKIVKQWEATRNGKGIELWKPDDSGIVLGLAYHPDRLICSMGDGRFIMLIGIVVPNHTSRYRKMSEDKFFRFVLGKEVKIKYDLKNITNVDCLFGYMKVGDIFVNAELLSTGYAMAKPMSEFTPQSTKYDELFKKLEEEARKNKRGIWAHTDNFND